MLTVAEAARRSGRHPETVRRWIREGRLPAKKIGTQHIIEEGDLEAMRDDGLLPAPSDWDQMFTDDPMPNWEEIIRRQRGQHQSGYPLTSVARAPV
jgi:excisionase family DNA binding protein